MDMREGTTTTTAGISRADVDQAITYLGMHNPKPEIPLEQTVSGHEIVAMATIIRNLTTRLNALEEAYANLLINQHTGQGRV